MAVPDPELALMQLKILGHKLDDEGLHVRANNVAHAMAVIETLAATRAEVIAALYAVELANDGCCPYCFAADDHTEDCVVGRALAKAEGA